MRIGIDLMGGDNPPELLFPAVLQIADQLSSDLSLLVIVTKSLVLQFSYLVNSLSPEVANRLFFHECEDFIAMNDDPLSSVRRKKKSSLLVGMDLLKTKRIDALVSCGNTGALIASAALTIPLLPGVSRPALLVALPTEKGTVAVLDAGGDLNNSSQDLIRFAFLGSAYQRAVQGIDVPKVGLLNVGVESRKGTKEVKIAYDSLKRVSDEAEDSNRIPCFHFSGNIEGRDVFKGSVDVVITDGFSGNILLKTAEGLAAFIFDTMQKKMKNLLTPDFETAFFELKKKFNYLEYPGAIVCGIDAVVIKAHGNAIAESLHISILGAINCLEKQVLAQLKINSYDN